MLQKIENMDFGAARYAVLKSLDTRDEIGREILRHAPHFLNTMLSICDLIERCEIEEVHPVDIGEIKPVQYSDLNCILSKLPMFVLLNSEYNWDSFCSGLILLISNFLEIQEQVLPIFDEESKQSEQFKIKTLKDSLAAVIRLVEIGSGYTELLQATSYLLSEIRDWKHASPISTQLSRAYLEALNYYPKEDS